MRGLQGSGSDASGGSILAKMKANRMVGVPYEDEHIDNAIHDLRMQGGMVSAEDYAGFEARWPDVSVPDLPTRTSLSELDALIAYLQVLGTMVDFSTYEAESPANLR